MQNVFIHVKKPFCLQIKYTQALFLPKTKYMYHLRNLIIINVKIWDQCEDLDYTNEVGMVPEKKRLSG